ncbi:nitroreductase family protein, partial [Chloroflexota bacterium]
MDVHEAILTRRSVRDYGDTPIPDESLMKVLEAARLAPSASNQQNWRFIVVKEESRRRGVAKAANNQMWIAGAPVIIAAVATEPKSIMTCGVPRYAVDLAIAVDHITLAAAAEGLG